jgi:hypothetical protein
VQKTCSLHAACQGAAKALETAAVTLWHGTGRTLLVRVQGPKFKTCVVQTLRNLKAMVQGPQFKAWPILEDLDWVRGMARRYGKPALVQQPLKASPRRWDHYGVLQTTLLNQLVLLGYTVGVPIHTLHWFYNCARNRYVSQE